MRAYQEVADLGGGRLSHLGVHHGNFHVRLLVGEEQRLAGLERHVGNKTEAVADLVDGVLTGPHSTNPELHGVRYGPEHALDDERAPIDVYVLAERALLGVEELIAHRGADDGHAALRLVVRVGQPGAALQRPRQVEH